MSASGCPKVDRFFNRCDFPSFTSGSWLLSSGLHSLLLITCLLNEGPPLITPLKRRRLRLWRRFRAPLTRISAREGASCDRRRRASYLLNAQEFPKKLSDSSTAQYLPTFSTSTVRHPCRSTSDPCPFCKYRQYSGFILSKHIFPNDGGSAKKFSKMRMFKISYTRKHTREFSLFLFGPI